MAMMDAFSRYEQMAILADNHPETEIKILEDRWLRWAGPPGSIKTDASGSHMSEKFISWTDAKGIKLIVIPKEAHYRLGVMERAHAVRRSQLMKMKAEEKQLDLDQAVTIAAEQRNRLRTIHGTSPAAIVFGAVPSQQGLSDEPWCIAAGDEVDQQEVVRLRVLAATAFHRPTMTGRCAPLSWQRGEPTSRTTPSARTSTYFRSQTPDGTASKYTPAGRWRGPALVCAIEEPHGSGPGSSMLWLSHGTSLVRCAPEQVRAEFPVEQAQRQLHSPETESTDERMLRVRRALRPARGPVRFLDFTARPSPTDAGEPMDADIEPTDMDIDPRPSLRPPLPSTRRQQRTRGKFLWETEKEMEKERPTGEQHPQPHLQSEPHGASSSAGNDGGHPQSSPGDCQTDEQPPQPHLQSEPHGASSATDIPRERSRSPPRRETSSQQVLEGINRARTMDGLPRLDKLPEQSSQIAEEQKPLYDLESMERNWTKLFSSPPSCRSGIWTRRN